MRVQRPHIPGTLPYPQPSAGGYPLHLLLPPNLLLHLLLPSLPSPQRPGPLPDSLSEFQGVEIIANNPSPEGEETLFNDVNNESEVGINNNDYPDCEILESALYGTRDLDTIMAEWNAKWSAAQESLGVALLEN